MAVFSLLVALPLAADPITDQLIVRTKSPSKQGLSQEFVGRLSQAAGKSLKLTRSFGERGFILKLSKKLEDKELKNLRLRLLEDPSVEHVEPDYLIQPLAAPSDTEYPNQWYLHDSTGGVRADKAWDISTGLANLVIAVIDTGIVAHEDIDTRVLTGYDFISDVAIANDGDKRDGDPTDTGDGTSQHECGFGHPGSKSSWHGLHVTGIVAASTNNALGVAGMNWGSQVLPVRALGKCGGYISDVIDGLRWAAGLSVSGAPANSDPADVINLSLGMLGSCSTEMQNAIDEATDAGSVVVVAAGNSNLNLDFYNATPAECDKVISVASIIRNGGRAKYSNYGKNIVIAAPGGASLSAGIVSTYNDGSMTAGSDIYESQIGTSMATPVVVGAISLMLSVNPGLNFVEVKNILTMTARRFPSVSGGCSTSTCGGGIVDSQAAVLGAKSMIVSNSLEVDFSTHTVKHAGKKRVTVTNPSDNSTAVIGSISLSGDTAFRVFDDQCSSQTLAPGASCQIQLEFLSESEGSFSASLSVPNNTMSSSLPVTVGGKAVAPAVPKEFGGCAMETVFYQYEGEERYIASLKRIRDQLNQSTIGHFTVRNYYAWGSDWLKASVLSSQTGAKTFRTLLKKLSDIFDPVAKTPPKSPIPSL